MTLKEAIKRVIYAVLETSYPKLEKDLTHYDVISLDVFDTALKRKCGEPQRVFEIVEKRSGVVGFKNERVSAEYRAYLENGARTNLKTIYKYYKASDELRNQLMNLELQVEDENLIANAQIRNLYSQALALGKTVVFVSDMYLPSSFITSALLKAGYETQKFVLVSNEFGKEKASGALFKVAVEQLHMKNNYNVMVHIGDSLRADFVGPRRVGIASRLIPNV